MNPLSLLSLGLITSTAVLVPLQTAEAWNGHHRGHGHSGPGFFFNFSPPPIYIAPARPVYVERRNVVVDVQSSLSSRGYDVGDIDGVLGQRTRSTLARFQHDAGLRETGEINEATLRALGL